MLTKPIRPDIGMHAVTSSVMPRIMRIVRLLAGAVVAVSILSACKRNRTGEGSSSTVAAGGSPSEGLLAADGAMAPQRPGPNVVVDQFGYLPSSEKIAVIRDPQIGFDATGANRHLAPGAVYALVDARSKQKVFEAAPSKWKEGATDASSGDRAWWFDFSTVATPGEYFVLDESNEADQTDAPDQKPDQKRGRSPVFKIANDVYRDVLVQAVRMFYYQRDGIAKEARYAGAAWADGVSHPQDTACTPIQGGGATQDLHGGWFDAGDQNRYTNWAASDVIELLRAYVENPAAFGDDSNIPESANGVADLLDEVKWELDWMGRMQQPDGAVLSIAGHAGASPPSTDASPCKYGPVSTSATLSSAAAFAFGSLVFGSAKGAPTVYPGYGSKLAAMAQKAWDWADANPSVSFYNSHNQIGSGEQEVDEAGRQQKKAEASAFLFELTGAATFKALFESSYAKLQGSFDPFHMEQLEGALEYTKATGASASVAAAIVANYKANVEGGYFGALAANNDPYLAYLQAYTWGSNHAKANQGNMFADVGAFRIDPAAARQATRYAERYIHYLHGVNPLGLVYLSSMESHGAETSVTRLFHTWFARGSKWDAVGVSPYGPPPGYLTGGPNPSYQWDGCCPSNCAGLPCGAAPPSPPTGQPPQKSYRDFNDGWPLDSWAVAEPDDTYQADYVRLLSKFVP